MIIKVAKKYFNSRINGILIRCVDVYQEEENLGKVAIVDERGDRFEYWINPEEIHEDINADYILCLLQHNSEINVSKY